MSALPRTRRQILELAGVGAATALAAGLLPSAAFAQNVPMADLMKPGALPDIWQGKADAPCTIIEYASATCSHCAHFHETTYKELKTKYIDTGKVRFTMREFPFDPLAQAGFMLARCSGDEKRDAVVALLLAQQANWAMTEKPLQGLTTLMRQTGMSQETFEACLKDQALYDNIGKVRDTGAEKYTVNSTPTFFINGTRLVGAVELAEMEKLILPTLKS
jgi:protein-disulfide isomerase